MTKHWTNYLAIWSHCFQVSLDPTTFIQMHILTRLFWSKLNPNMSVKGAVVVGKLVARSLSTYTTRLRFESTHRKFIYTVNSMKRRIRMWEGQMSKYMPENSQWHIPESKPPYKIFLIEVMKRHGTLGIVIYLYLALLSSAYMKVGRYYALVKKL